MTSFFLLAPGFAPPNAPVVAPVEHTLLGIPLDTSERRIETVVYSHVLRLGTNGATFELPVASTVGRSPQRRTLLAQHASDVSARLHALTRGFFAEVASGGGAA